MAVLLKVLGAILTASYIFFLRCSTTNYIEMAVLLKLLGAILTASYIFFYVLLSNY